MKRKIIDYILKNKQAIITLSICLFIGIVFGIVGFNFLSDSSRESMINEIKQVLDLSKGDDFNGINIISNGLKSSFILITVIILATFTILAPAIICITYFVKGFSIGMYIATIYAIFNFLKGSLITFTSTIIPNIIFIPIFIYIGIASIEFYYDIMFDKDRKLRISKFVKYMYQIAISLPFIFLSIILEQLFSSVILSLYVGI